MSETKILLVDPSSMTQPFLGEVLQNTGDVTHFEEPNKALNAVKKGLDLDIAVLRYRLSLTPLIQAIRHERPSAKIVAYGSPRSDTPLGVDRYINQPLLSAELLEAVEDLRAKRRPH